MGNSGKDNFRSAWRAALGASLLACALTPALAQQQNLPAGPLKFVHPFPAGSGSDLAYRPVMEKLGEVLGKPVVVEGHPGGSSTVASLYVKKQPADGSVFYQLSATPIVRSLVNPEVDMRKDFTPISCITNAPLILAVNSDLKINTLKELMDAARAHPGEINYASYGVGSGAHLVFEYLTHEAGVKMTHVPYQGSAQAALDTAAGRTQATGIILATAAPLVKQLGGNGKLTMLAVSTLEPTPLIPGVPGLKAAGFPQVDWGLWAGIVGPAGIPRPAVDALYRAFNQVYKDPKVIDMIAKVGQDPLYCTPDELGRRISHDYDTFSKLVRDTGIKLE